MYFYSDLLRFCQGIAGKLQSQFEMKRTSPLFGEVVKKKSKLGPVQWHKR